MRPFSFAALFPLILLALAAAPPQPAGAQTSPLGPLEDAARSQMLQGWESGVDGTWFMMRNTAQDEAEQTLTIPAGPPPEGGRRTLVQVSVASKEASASVGLMVRSGQAGALCLMEITAQAAANLFCVEGGKTRTIANLPNAARMDGSDTIEMVDVPGAARFYLNGQQVGDVEGSPALGDEIGIMAYDRGTFGLSGFSIANVESAPAPQPEAGQGGGSAPTLAQVMGPLADAIQAATAPEGWQVYLKNDWLVYENAAKAGGSMMVTMPAGPPGAEGRLTKLAVGILPAEGWRIEDMPKSAVGLVIDNPKANASCVGEITGARDGLVLCFGPDGASHEMGRLPGAAHGDGSDTLTLYEVPGLAEFALNGQVIAQVANDPSQGADVGILAWERGLFHVGAFAIGPAQSQGGGSTGGPAGQVGGGGQGSASLPLPMFGNDTVRLVSVYLGLTNGIFMHEFGHALIGELQLPSTGPEEDAVDIFAALRVVEPTMYPSGEKEIDQIGAGVATYAALQWYYSGKLGEQSGSVTPWMDEHTADLKRFRNVFCVLYGGNPALFQGMAQEVGFDDRTLGRCGDEFTKQNRAWRTILAPHTRVGQWSPEGMLPADAPGQPIDVVFEPSRFPVGQFITERFSDALRGFAEELAKTYALPRPMKVIYRDCDQLNAWYSNDEASITMCYDLLQDLAVMISDIEDGPAAGGTVPASSGGGTGGGAAPAPAKPLSNELQDLGVPPTSLLFPAPYRGPTPSSHTKAEVVTTEGLAQLLNQGGRVLLIDTSGASNTLPQALAVPDAGRDGSVTDSFQQVLSSWLQEQTGGNGQVPIVFFGAGMQDRSSYNGALRVGQLGWHVYWYRGGIEAWVANGLPLAPAQ
ncbi:DUF4344 domain-containing metallopeptidase [Fuscibacter oryzae]|uniref:Rhodanese domain-containing protein n=1 Tax=Fuscibacter oryzae TaxID=2803939 RepID=A0A8J7MS39_9RHOB|nr:DUF4344 domain-containing metallopeptidase [Fuscibacter oryzae]MBL4928481.1 hypothetical protein [Fuscibacter oryzae]